MASNRSVMMIAFLLFLQLAGLFLALFFSAQSGAIAVVLLCSALLTAFVLMDDRRLQAALAQVTENASRIHKRQKMLPINAVQPVIALNMQLENINQEINEFQRKEHSVINHALDVICSVSHDQVFQSVNPAAQKVWGYSPAELVGTKFSDLIIEDDRQKSIQSLFGAEKSVDTLSFESRVRRKDGSVVHSLWSAHWSAADQALFCVAHDITARKLAEKLLEESEQRIRQIFEDMPVGLIMSNKLGLIEMSNPALDLICQTDANELIGKHIKSVLPDLLKSAVPPDYAALVGALSDTTAWRKAGGSIPIQVTARELTMTGEKKYLLVLIDVTEHEKLEQLKQEFFAMVSHDLRSPLTSLFSFLDALAAGSLGDLSDKGKDVVSRNLRELDRLIKLVDELLDIEKMKSGKFVIESELVPADSIIESSIAAMEYFAQRRGITIQFAKTRLYVYAGSALLIRVLVNLLSNAIKFSPSGSVIRLELLEQDSDLLFSVTDTGRGVPLEFRQRIFEQYEQVQPSDSVSKGGTGLGLPICKMIVEQHEGRIWVESNGERGSSFKFTIPRKSPAL